MFSKIHQGLQHLGGNLTQRLARLRQALRHPVPAQAARHLAPVQAQVRQVQAHQVRHRLARQVQARLQRCNENI